MVIFCLISLCTPCLCGYLWIDFSLFITYLLITYPAKAATAAAGGRIVRTVHRLTVFVGAHFYQQIAQGVFQFGSVIYGVSTIGIAKDAVRGALAEGALYQQTIRCQLKNVRIVGGFGRATPFDLHRNQRLTLLDEIVWLASQVESGIVQRLFDLSPTVGIRVNHSSGGEAGGTALPHRQPEEDESEEDEEKREKEQGRGEGGVTRRDPYS